MRIFRRKFRTETEAATRAVIMYHNNGLLSITIKKVSPKMLSYLQKNLGRDAVYSFNDYTLNLKEYSTMQIVNPADVVEEGITVQE
jgi:hypothetical protein